MSERNTKMPKKKSTENALVTSTTPTFYPIAETTIEPTQVFRVPKRHPAGDGPWRNEADKVAWIDKATGLACTILRHRDGSLGGYCAVSETHPLFGFNHDAIPAALGISVHGGIDYSRACDNGPTETSVCHPSPTRGGDHEPLWWFGFRCDRSYDYIPTQNPRDNDLGAEAGRTYKSEGYVYLQTVKLASQLKAIEDSTGESGVSLDLAPSPPVGLDPESR
jgi:hypothetical protein